MQHHPLTPMKDPNIVRVLAAQTSLTVDLIRLNLVRQGEKAVLQAFETRESRPATVAVTDAIPMRI